MSNLKFVALVNYDLMPGIIGAEITNTTDLGKVQLAGYSGVIFNPRAIVPAVTGEKILNELRALAQRYQIEQNALQAEYHQQVNGILAYYNLPPRYDAEGKSL